MLAETSLTPRLAVFTLGGDGPAPSYGEARRLVGAGGGEDAVTAALVAAYPRHLLPDAAGTAWAAGSVRR